MCPKKMVRAGMLYDTCVDSVGWRESESIRYKFWFRSSADGAAGDSPFTKEYFLFLLIFK